MNVFRKAFLFVSAPLLGLFIPALIVGLLSPSEGLVPFQAWILIAASLILSGLLAFVWARYLYPRLHRSLEQHYQGRWEKGELMVATAALISTLGLGLLYRPCIFTVEPYCRGFLASTEMLLRRVSREGLAFTAEDQRASAVIGSFAGLIVTFTILLDEIFSRLLFYWHHRNE